MYIDRSATVFRQSKHLGGARAVLRTQKFEIRHREVQNPSFGNKNSYFSVHALLHHIMENFRGVVVVVVNY